MKSNYWSCSKFADWLRGMPKLEAGTTEEWKTWRKAAKQKKFRYWLAEEGLHHLQSLIYWPFIRIKGLSCYIQNRWVNQSHALISTLKRGHGYDFNTRLLHAVFDELINFVEIELAWAHVVFSKEGRQKYKTPWYCTFCRIGAWRSPEAGLAYLQWASELKIDEEWVAKNDPKYGQPTQQALAAQEIFALYQWWKEDRPNRSDPSEASGWNRYYEENCNEAYDQDDEQLLAIFASNNEKNKRLRDNILDKYHQLEQAQEEEDTVMLIRLIKIRQSLWT